VDSFRTGEEIKLITAWQAVFKKSQERNNICLLGVHKVRDKEGKNDMVFCSPIVR